MNVKALILIPLTVLAYAAQPAPAHAERLRCRDTLHGYACDSDKGNFEVRCRNDLLGVTCNDNKGGTTRCRDTLHGSDCDIQKGRKE